MAKYRVQGPDGAIHVFEGPDEATQEQIIAFAQQQFSRKPGTPAAVEKPPQVDDPGAFMAALIGAGRTTDQIIDGMKQLGFNLTGNKDALEQLRAENEEKTRLYKPLQDQHSVATALGESLPSMVIPAGGGATLAATVGRLAAAGAIPGALEYGSAGERAGRAAGGAAAGAVGGVVVPKVIQAVGRAVPAIGRTAKAIVEPLYDGGRKAIAGRTLNNAAGDEAVAVAQRLAGAAELVPNSLPTAAQVAENGGIAALERTMAASKPAEFADRTMRQAAARTTALQDIAGDAGKKELFKSARSASAKELYDKAYSVPIEMENLSPAMRGEVSKLMGIPAIQYALKTARENAANHGMSTQSMEGSIAGLHHAKLAMDDMISAAGGAGSKTGAEANKAAAIEAAQKRLVTFMEKMSPDYGEARATYAAMSKPINQMDVGQHLLEKMKPALTDHGALARENANAYAGALRDGDQLVKNSTGRSLKFDDVMDPSQVQSLQAVAQDLARKANSQDLGRGVGSDTFQKLSMSNIAGQSGAPRVMGAVLNAPGVSKVAKFLYSEPEEKIQSLIAQSLLEPKSAAQLMTAQLGKGPKPASDLLFANPARATQLTGGAAGFTAGNLFAQ